MIATRAEFARLTNVSKGRVTQWIAEGKISGEALVGEGRSAKIRVDVARRQIGLRRDVGQAIGNGLKTKLRPSKPGTKAADPALPMSEDDLIDAAIKRQRLLELEARNRRQAEEEAERQGRYVLAKKVRTEMSRMADELMRAFQGSLPEMASAIAAEHKLEYRNVLHVLRTSFDKYRRKVAERIRQEAAEKPALVPADDLIAEE